MQGAPPVRPALLTVDGIAFELNVSVATVWRWAKTDPTFPKSFKLGENCTRWYREQIDAWVSAKSATLVEA